MSRRIKLCVLVGLVCALSTPGRCQSIQQTTGSSSSVSTITLPITGAVIGLLVCLALCIVCCCKKRRYSIPSSRHGVQHPHSTQQQQNYTIRPQQIILHTASLTTSDVPKATLHLGTEPPLYHEAINIKNIQLHVPNTELSPPPYCSTVRTELDVNVSTKG